MSEIGVVMLVGGFWFVFLMGMMIHGFYLDRKNGSGKGPSF